MIEITSNLQLVQMNMDSKTNVVTAKTADGKLFATEFVCPLNRQNPEGETFNDPFAYAQGLMGVISCSGDVQESLQCYECLLFINTVGRQFSRLGEVHLCVLPKPQSSK